MPNHPDTPRSGNSPGQTHSSTTSTSSDEGMKEKVKQDAAHTADKVKQEARQTAETAKARAQAEAESGKQRASEEVDTLSDAVEAAASALEEEDHEGLANYAHDLSHRMGRFADQLRDRSVEDLARDARNLARENPTAFLVGSVAIGFGLSRFFKASQTHSSTGAGASSASSASSTKARVPHDRAMTTEAPVSYGATTRSSAGTSASDSGRASAPTKEPSAGRYSGTGSSGSDTARRSSPPGRTPGSGIGTPGTVGSSNQSDRSNL